MEVSVKGPGPASPFLSARDRFLTAYDLSRPVEVHVRENPDERTWAAHYDDRHVLNMSQQAATSAMARELTLHEFAHMHRWESGHPSHTQSTEEALFLALAGRSVERRKVKHCYQIANHMKDIYADDLTLAVVPSSKLVAFMESQLASAVADRPTRQPDQWTRLTATTDPEVTAINAAFALALLERHDLLHRDHRIYDLVHAANRDAPSIGLEAFKQRFADLDADVDESQFRKALVDAVRAYTIDRTAPAAD